MKIIKKLLFCAGLIAGVACQQKKDEGRQFPVTLQVTPSFVPIQEIIQIGNLYKQGDYMILQNTERNASSFFYVYSYPDFHYLYSFCPRGNGPGEYLMPAVIKNTPGNIFSFRDHGTDQIVTYQLSDSAALPAGKFDCKPDETHFFWEINYIDANKYVLKSSTNQSNARELWDLAQRKKLASLPNTFDLAQEMGENYYPEFDDFQIASFAEKMVFAYFLIDRIEIGQVKGDKMQINTSIGTNKIPDFHLFNQETEGKYKYSVDYNRVYYEYVTCTDQYIYALSARIPWGDLNRQHSSILEVYDWQGKPVKAIHLQQSLSAFTVDENTQTIYGINPDTTEDAILVYKMEEKEK